MTGTEGSSVSYAYHALPTGWSGLNERSTAYILEAVHILAEADNAGLTRYFGVG
jgi:hypothetical protein